MAKAYELEGKIYCDDDLSEQYENWGGDLFDLFWELKKKGEAVEVCFYYSTYSPEITYDTCEELIEKEFKNLEVGNG